MTVKELCEALSEVPDDYNVQMLAEGAAGEVVAVMSDARHNEVTLFAD